MSIVEIKHDFVDITTNYGHLFAIKAETGVVPNGEKVSVNQMFPYYTRTLQEPNTFYYISIFEINEFERGKGLGRKLLMKFYNQYNPSIVLLDCGIIDENEFNSMNHEEREEYVKYNIYPFWKKMGFHCIDCFKHNEDGLPMIWPKSEAERIDKIYKRICIKEGYY